MEEEKDSWLQVCGGLMCWETMGDREVLPGQVIRVGGREGPEIVDFLQMGVGSSWLRGKV